MSRLEVLTRLESIGTGIRGVDDFRSQTPFFEIEMGETGKWKPNTLDANEEWHLTAKLTVTFWANRAQLDRARETAERALVHRLYADTLGDLAELRLAISNGDRSASMAVCDRIESKLTR